MSRTYIQTVTDPETGQEYELQLETDDDDVDNIRNRRPGRPSGGTGHGRFSLTPSKGSRRPGPRPAGHSTSLERPTSSDRPVTRQPASNVQNDGEYLTIRKDALAGLVSLGGQFWAAYLVRPDMPRSTNNPIVDFNNAAMHRDALAEHDQSRDRIRAFSELAERALRALMS